MRVAIAAAVLAFALTLVYAAWLQPEWEPQLNDQFQYLSLARGLVDRGEFTRALVDEPFIPETYRLPGYPLLIAPLCLGGCDHWRIAIAQGLLLAALVLVTYLMARRLAPGRAPLAAVLVAVYLPFSFYAALALSDLAGAVFCAFGIALWVRALDSGQRRQAFASGALLGFAALMRGALVLLPLALAGLAVATDRRTARLAITLVASAVIVLAPYVAYSEREFGRFSGGTTGLVLFLGATQGRSESSFDAFEEAEVLAARREIATFDGIADRVERGRAWLALDDALGAHARALIGHDPLGWLARAVPRTIELFDGDRPVRGGLSGGDVASLAAAAQLVIAAIGAIGVARLARLGGLVAPVAAIVVVYVWLISVPFGTEGRYALPARAFLLIGVAASYRARRVVGVRRSGGSQP